jgi:hypothetical protein
LSWCLVSTRGHQKNTILITKTITSKHPGFSKLACANWEWARTKSVRQPKFLTLIKIERSIKVSKRAFEFL